MNFKFNTYNEEYIMLDRFSIFIALAKLESINNRNKYENEMYKTFININRNILTYEHNPKKYFSAIQNIAINKNSKLGNYLLANQEKTEHIIYEDLINALLVCIHKNDWQHYEILLKLIKDYGQAIEKKQDKKNFIINVAELSSNIGEEITNYIIDSKLYNTKNLESNKYVYLYKNNKIIKTELPIPTSKKEKTKTRKIN